ncbi:hypothetical protein PLICRDRAFT_37420 [Plicaturopsis crispa FD-325 SS-3]|nr:hypothetical protein PLICRDRAFT_37420 [Plicaturopsis crispa FD-325 SS-3]
MYAYVYSPTQFHTIVVSSFLLSLSLNRLRRQRARIPERLNSTYPAMRNGSIFACRRYAYFTWMST